MLIIPLRPCFYDKALIYETGGKQVLSKNIDEKTIAKEMLHNTFKIEESLADILRSEARMLRKKTGKDFDSVEIQKVNRTIRYILYSIMMIDERIQKGIDIINNNHQKS